MRRRAIPWLVCVVYALASGLALGAGTKTMKAVVAHQYGGPEVLKPENAPVPEPKENEILVRVIASGVNPADPPIVGGKYAKELGTDLPLTLGYDMEGEGVNTRTKTTNRQAAG